MALQRSFLHDQFCADDEAELSTFLFHAAFHKLSISFESEANPRTSSGACFASIWSKIINWVFQRDGKLVHIMDFPTVTACYEVILETKTNNYAFLSIWKDSKLSDTGM